MLGAGPRLEHGADLRVVDRKADGVALMEHQVGERGGDVLGVLEFADRPTGTDLGGNLAGEAHAAGGIDEQMGLEVGFFLVFLDVVTVGLADGAPVDMADLVPGVILAMLGELDGEALVGTFVDAGEETLDERARHQSQVAVLRQGGGIELDVSGHAISILTSFPLDT